MNVPPLKSGETGEYPKNPLAETPAGSNAAPVSLPLLAVPDSVSPTNSCLSPRRPRQQRAACKPSPARNAAAVILATLLGGQGQQSEACPTPKSGKAAVGKTSSIGKRASVTTRSSSKNVNSCVNEPCENDYSQNSVRSKTESGSWLAREAVRGKRQRGEGGRDSVEGWSSPDVSHPGRESRRNAQWQRQSLRQGKGLQDSPERDGGAGTPASATMMRRPSPRKRAAIRRVGRGDNQAGAVKTEGLLEDGKRRTPPPKEGELKIGESQSSSDNENRPDCSTGIGMDSSVKKEKWDNRNARLLLSSPEGGGGGGLGSGDEMSYTFNNYCRKDKSLGLLCGRFVEVYGRSQHFKARVETRDVRAARVNSAVPNGGSSEAATEGMVELDRAAEDLGVARRRIYDVINILESLCVVSRARKNTYRWHGKSNLVSTLQQLQRAAALVFPDEVVKNDMADCLRRSELDLYNSSDMASCCIGGPRPDGQKEKSLGGLCRRFVQLFLVGNEVVSVAAAAEKLSEPEDVASGNVVYKTRARRLYDIANALAALGLVEKVRSRESHKPNFRWIGVPAKTLATLAWGTSHDGTTLYSDHVAITRQHPSPSPKSDVKRKGGGRDRARNSSPALSSPSPSPCNQHVIKATEEQSMVSNPCGSKWPLVSREVDERTLSPSTRNLKRPAINVEELNSRVKRRQRSSLLNTTRAELVLQTSSCARSWRTDNMSPSVHAEKRSCNFRAISPTVSQSTPSIGGFTPDDDASDQDSPVDPREVMRQFSDYDGADEYEEFGEEGHCDTSYDGDHDQGRARDCTWARANLNESDRKWLAGRRVHRQHSSMSPSPRFHERSSRSQSDISGETSANAVKNTMLNTCASSDRPVHARHQPSGSQTRVAGVMSWRHAKNQVCPDESQTGSPHPDEDDDDSRSGAGDDDLEVEESIDGDTLTGLKAHPTHPPHSPATVRRRHIKLLDGYMKTYTEQWNLWRQASQDGNMPPPPLPPTSPCPTASVLEHCLRSSNHHQHACEGIDVLGKRYMGESVVGTDQIAISTPTAAMASRALPVPLN